VFRTPSFAPSRVLQRVHTVHCGPLWTCGPGSSMSSDALTDQQRRLLHKPIALDALRAEAVRLQSEGYRVRDLAQIFGMNDAAVVAFLEGKTS